MSEMLAYIKIMEIRLFLHLLNQKINSENVLIRFAMRKSHFDKSTSLLILFALINDFNTFPMPSVWFCE